MTNKQKHEFPKSKNEMFHFLSHTWQKFNCIIDMMLQFHKDRTKKLDLLPCHLSTSY